MKTITVRISKFGDTKIDAEGFAGTECVVATQAIEQALGGHGKRNLKPEYDQPESANTEVAQGLRF